MLNKISFLILTLFINLNASKISPINSFYNKHYNSNNSINDIKKNEENINVKLNKTVFGYLPWWEYIQGSTQFIHYDLITHLAIFSFEADSFGNINDPMNWPWNEVISNAKANNVKLILCVTNFNSDDINRILNNPDVRNKLFNNIAKKINSYNFDGINIDFENIKIEDRNFVLTNFLVELKKYFINIKPGLEISFASPSVNFGGWNFESLVQVCDYLFVMCYDYYGSWNDFTAPSSPLTGTFFNITKSFDFDYYNIVKAQPEKLILGVPYYGNYWKTNSKEPYTKVDTSKSNKEWVDYLTYKQIMNNYSTYEKLWDSISQTPWIRWFDTKWNQIWFDDEKSLSLKYDFAIQRKIKGIGIWALGYDGNRNELWNLIQQKFLTSSIENISYSVDFKIEQNYPNPFNGETVINYSLNEDGNVKLYLYDSLGKLIVKLIDEYKLHGKYSIKIDAKNFNLTTGVYFYKITSGKNSMIKKMILLK